MASFIWTNHVVQRLKERKISQALIIQAICDPDETEVNKEGGMTYRKKIQNQTVIAVVKKNERGEDVVISGWVNPPNPGTKDFKNKKRYLELQKASFWKKFWLTFLGQMGW